MRRLLAIAVVLGVLGVIDLAAKLWVETGIERSARARVQDVGSVDAEISSFPFLGRLLLPGEVSHFRLTLEDVVGRGVPVAELRMDVDGLELDRDTLLNRSRVRITDVDSVTVTAVLSRDDLAEALGIGAAALELVEGQTIEVTDGRLQLGAGLSVAVPAAELVPCDATVTVRDEAVVLECESETLPSIVVEAIGSIDLRRELGL